MLRARSGRLAASLGLLVGALTLSAWGFYAHREINRLATYTLPAELARFYKRNLAYVSAHAVDPDKRRYAAPLEGPRHYIDLERFGDGTVKALPRDFWAFHDRFTVLHCHTGVRDSVEVRYSEEAGLVWVGPEAAEVGRYEYADWYDSVVVRRAYQREEPSLDSDLPQAWGLPTCRRLTVFDTAMQHGVLPYHLAEMQRRLTYAFRRGDEARILRLSAELGHYVGDATVPLHTTVNYNGQLTGQRGIHAFWESRIPELFAADEFDVLVGAARYLPDPTQEFRRLIAESHALVDSVLLIEADLRRKVPEELQDCYEERLGQVTRVPCRGFARAYYERLDGMVEARFRRAVRTLGSCWYTAWVDAGQPALSTSDLPEGFATSDTIYARRDGLDGRGH